MTKSEMLERISSYEIAEWIAYELKNGPLGPAYRDDMMASINELLQANNYLTGGAAGGKRNPAPKPKAVPRPWDLHKKEKRRPRVEEDEAEEE